MTKEIKMIACDLDGTLLNNHKVISQSTIDKLIEYENQDYLITLASGRYYKEVKSFAKQLRLDEFHGYAVCSNGYEIVEAATEKRIYFEPISCEVAHYCVDMAKECHLMQYVKINGVYHLSTSNVEKKVMNAIRTSFHHLSNKGVKQISYASHLLDESVFEKDLKPFIHEPVVKICVIGSPSNQKKWIQKLEEKHPHTFAYYPVNPYALEITHKSVSKKHAVETIASMNGFTLDEVIAFGDSGNDEPLLMSAGIGITMKNGTKRALKKAKIVSEYTNHEDGVIKECIKYLSK